MRPPSGELPAGVRDLLLWQLTLALALSALALVADSAALASAAIGALIGCVGQAVLAGFTFRFSGARAAGSIARGLARGATSKFIVIAALLLGVLSPTVDLLPLWLLGGLLCVQGMVSFFPLIDRRHRGARTVRRDDN